MPHFINHSVRIALVWLFVNIGSFLDAQTNLPHVLVLDDAAAGDQDDMCIWIHPDPTQSTIITSDKGANKVIVYDLQGNTLQIISFPNKTRNIDVRYNFPLSSQPVDIVGFGMDVNIILFYTVDPTTRLLSPAGSFNSQLGDVYGFALYHSPFDGKYYAMVTNNSGSGQIEQWELIDNGNGTIGGIHKRTWTNGVGGLTEGLVADDETGKFYAASEDQAIYKYDADPVDPNPIATLVASVGQNGLTADIEGITIYYAANGEGYLIASSQGSDNFKVYERKPPHNFVMTFTVQSTNGTDGIDVTNVNLGGLFSEGLFLAHDGSRVFGAKFADTGLLVDTAYWNPRNGGDNIAPGPVRDFDIETDATNNQFVFATWDGNSSGDDGTSGTITGFEIRWTAAANGPIDTDGEWTAATVAYSGDAAAFATGSEHIDMSSFPSGNKFFAIRTTDDVGNISPLESGSYTALPDFSLPVTLLSFEAIGGIGKIILTWETAGEVNNEGFFIYRAKSEAGPFNELLNQQIIAGQGNTNAFTRYEYTDNDLNEGVMYYYSLVSCDFDGTIHDYSIVASATPLDALELRQNFPNTFNARTHFEFTIAQSSIATMNIYNALGQKVCTLFSQVPFEPGVYTHLSWDAIDENGEQVVSGIYYYRLWISTPAQQTGSVVKTRMMNLLK
jgi:3-phytase